MTSTPLMTLRFTLPWAPSVNTYWRHTVRGGKQPVDGGELQKGFAKVYISKQGLQYRVAVRDAVIAQQVPRHALKGRLGIDVIGYPPDARERDLDNQWKGMLDALVDVGVIANDFDIDDERLRRGPVRAPGALVIRLWELSAEEILSGIATTDDLFPTAVGAPKRQRFRDKARRDQYIGTARVIGGGDPF